MGSTIEINDTLALTAEQGFPAHLLDLDAHRQTPVRLEDLSNERLSFQKEEARLFHLDPVRVFLVQSLKGRWIFWGHALIESQSIDKVLDAEDLWVPGTWSTRGTFTITDIYPPDYQESFTRRESPPGRSHFA